MDWCTSYQNFRSVTQMVRAETRFENKQKIIFVTSNAVIYANCYQYFKILYGSFQI